MTRLIDFTQPYFPPSPSVYIARAGAGDEAAGGKVAAQVSTVQADHLSELGATLQEYELAPEVVSAVLSGEVDAALVDLEFAQESLDKSAGKLTIVGPRVMLDAGIGVGVRESDSELKDKLDRAIDGHERGRLVERPDREMVRRFRRDVLTASGRCDCAEEGMECRHE